MNQFKYITVMDIDETILPVKNELFSLEQVVNYTLTNNKTHPGGQSVDKCDRYNGESSISSYLDELNARMKIKEPRSFYFRQGYFLTKEIVTQLFQSLESMLGSIDSASANESIVNYNLSVFDKNRFDPVENVSRPFEFVFTIKSKSELQYALALRDAYKKTIEPFLVKHGTLIKNLTRNYDRFLILTGAVTNDRSGKTIHYTQSTFDFSIHLVENVLNVTGEKPFVDYGSRLFTWVGHDLGHLSHFRSFYNFNYKTIPISSIYLDFNYFNCFFVPIIKRFSQDLAV
jgi:hypothetical protein